MLTMACLIGICLIMEKDGRLQWGKAKCLLNYKMLASPIRTNVGGTQTDIVTLNDDEPLNKGPLFPRRLLLSDMAPNSVKFLLHLLLEMEGHLAILHLYLRLLMSTSPWGHRTVGARMPNIRTPMWFLEVMITAEIQRMSRMKGSSNMAAHRLWYRVSVQHRQQSAMSVPEVVISELHELVDMTDKMTKGHRRTPC